MSDEDIIALDVTDRFVSHMSSIKLTEFFEPRLEYIFLLVYQHKSKICNVWVGSLEIVIWFLPGYFQRVWCVQRFWICNYVRCSGRRTGHQESGWPYRGQQASLRGPDGPGQVSNESVNQVRWDDVITSQGGKSTRILFNLRAVRLCGELPVEMARSNWRNTPNYDTINGLSLGTST